jgi:2-dehydro-3-deoxyglucarate aldolase
MQIPHSSIAEIMSQAGFDWIAVDMEHGSISPHQLPDLFRALELGNTLPLVRLAQGSVKDCKQALDAGAAGVVVPMVESASQLQSVRSACCWPPAGTRGVGFSRANGFGTNFDVYFEEAQSPLLVAMIEHVNAVKKLPEILSVPGLDAILIGPYDLSASMGKTACFDDAEFKSVMREILEEANRSGVPCGLHVVKPDFAVVRERIAEGYRFLAYAMDSTFLTSAMEDLDLPGKLA